MAVTADNASNNITFLKVLENVCNKKEINFNHKKNNVCCLAHIINLTVQEILKYIKAGEAQEEDEILELISQEKRQENHINIKIMPRLRRLVIKLQSSP